MLSLSPPLEIYLFYMKITPFSVKIIFYPRKIKVYSKNCFVFYPTVAIWERDRKSEWWKWNKTFIATHTLEKKAEFLWTKQTQLSKRVIHGSRAINIVTTFRSGEKKVRKPENVFPLLLKTSLLRSTNAFEWVTELKRKRQGCANGRHLIDLCCLTAFCCFI